MSKTKTSRHTFPRPGAPTVERLDDGVIFHIEMMCFVHSVLYDYDQRKGVVRMGAHSSTDMCGAIELFRAIDPGVEQVVTTTSDGLLDMVYVHDPEGNWHAKDFRGHAVCLERTNR